VEKMDRFTGGFMKPSHGDNVRC